MIIFAALNILASSFVHAGQGLNTIPKEFSNPDSKESEIIVGNMPRIRSQDTLGICYAFSAQAIIDHANCTAGNVKDCASVENKNLISVTDITRFNRIFNKDWDIDKTDRFMYEGLDFDKGGSSAFLIQTALNTGALVKDECAPFDQLISQVDNPEEAHAINTKMWADFKAKYKQVQKGKLSAQQATKEIKDNFCLSTPEVDVLNAFADQTYSGFLDKLLVPDKCWDFKNQTTLKGSWQLNIFPDPKTPKKDRNYKTMLNTLKNVLRNGEPLILEFCAQEKLTAKSSSECGKSKSGHSVAINGYRRLCNAKQECRDVVKVHNSWGKAWQEQNNDGWVDAKTLLDRTFYENQALTWLSKAEPE